MQRTSYSHAHGKIEEREGEEQHDGGKGLQPESVLQDSVNSNGDFWNPAFMQQQQRQQQQFTFTNPWGDEPQQVLPPISTSTNTNDDHTRRKSSIVIPPVRAPGPQPFQYEHYQVPPNADATAYQQRIFIHNDPSQYMPSYSTSGQFDHNDFNRRQSIATAYYNNSNAATGSAANNFNGPAIDNYNNVPNIRTDRLYRRLSAYPQNLAPSYQYLRDESLSKPQPVTIPQMQKCTSKQDTKPMINKVPEFRRASLNSKTISPLIALTASLITTYSLCSPDFSYKTSKNPKRVLTKPSEGKHNNGYDNINSDYILYVNDILGVEQNRKYLVLDILGQGTFGQVVKCQNVLNKEIVAVKVVKSRTEYLNQSVSEVKILELLKTKIDPMNKHHFLRLYDTFVHKNHFCLVFELLSNNLYELLKQNQFHGLAMSLIRTFTKQLLDSLCILKNSKLVHCDLKPENILLCTPDKPDLKIIDFGSSCEERRTLYTYIQSRFYRAPEVILGIPYSTSIDMWSLGCIVAELFLGIPIFPGSSEFNQLTRIIDTLGYPPVWMMDRGKSSSKFLKNFRDTTTDAEGNTILVANRYELKTVEEFNQQYHANEKPSKQYFKWTKLDDIIKNYRIPKRMQNMPDFIEQEMKDRQCLTHFLKGILNLNPLERWTPQQASMHPFITQQPFNGEWYPLGMTSAVSE